MVCVVALLLLVLIIIDVVVFHVGADVFHETAMALQKLSVLVETRWVPWTSKG